MPRFEKLSQEEVQEVTKRKPSRIDLGEYTEYLNTLNNEEWGSVTLDTGERARAIKRRLTIASRSANCTIKYRKTTDKRIVFKVKREGISIEKPKAKRGRKAKAA